jgi:hypothetical protein
MIQPDEELLSYEATLDPDRRDPEAPTEDALEQATPVDAMDEPALVRLPLEANEADVVEQAQVVNLDDEYD